MDLVRFRFDRKHGRMELVRFVFGGNMVVWTSSDLDSVGNMVVWTSSNLDSVGNMVVWTSSDLFSAETLTYGPRPI